MAQQTKPAYRFGRFLLDTAERRLLREGQSLSLTPKILDTLLILVENHGRLVEKSDFMQRLWPDTFVEEITLASNISDLRKALGEGVNGQKFIETVPKSGYRFVAEVEVVVTETPAAQSIQSSGPASAIRPRHKLIWLWGAFFVLVAVAVWGASLWRNSQPADKPLLRLNVDFGSEVSLDSSGFSFSPDGTRVVYRSKGRLFSRNLDRSVSQELAGTYGAVSPFLSPDGKWVAFWTAGKLMKVSLESGAQVKLCDADPANFGSAVTGSWGEDDSIIASLAPTGGLWRIPAAGGTPRPVTSLDAARGEVTHRWPQILPGEKAVLFTSHTKVLGGFDDANIEVANLSDGRRKILHRGGAHARYLPSGHLIFLRRGTLYAARFDLNRLEMLDTPTPLVDSISYRSINGDADFDVSRTGTLIYMQGAGLPGRAEVVVRWLDASGQMQPFLTRPGLYSRPRVSPDGRRLTMRAADASGIDIWVYDSRGDTMIRLTDGSASPDSPIWTPDGRFIVFDDVRGTGMFWSRSDGQSKPQPLIRGTKVQQPYSFSPDGRRLAFMESGTGGFDLWTVPVQNDGTTLRGGKPEPFLQTRFDERHPSFSPDGHWIAYSSNETGPFEVYVRAFPNTGQKWRVSNGGGINPAWSRNGRELFYRTEDQRIMVAGYTIKGSSFQADQPRQWSEQRPADVGGTPANFDVAPDGERLAVLVAASGPQHETQHHVIFLENFFDEVRRKVKD